MADDFGRTRKAKKLKVQQDKIQSSYPMEVGEGTDLASTVMQHSSCTPAVAESEDCKENQPVIRTGDTNDSSECENEILYLIASGLSEFWKRKLYYDVTLYCGVDGETIKSHRIVLAGLSPIFRAVLSMAEQDPRTANPDEEVIILPDVNSKTLLRFLDSIYLGKSDKAFIDDEITYLRLLDYIDSNMPSINSAQAQMQACLPVDMDVIDQYDEMEVSRFASKRSFVWDYFTPIGKQNARCNLCNKVQKVEKSSTTYLIRHLKTNHHKQYSECKPKQDKGNESMDCEEGLPFGEDSTDYPLNSSFETENEKTVPNYGIPLETDKKHIRPSPSKFRFLTNQISKLAKAKGDGSDSLSESKSTGRRKRSLCWKYFSRPMGISGSDNNDCKCNICGHALPLSSSKSTILMLRHLRREHKEVFDLSISPRSSVEQNNLLGTKDSSNTKTDKEPPEMPNPEHSITDESQVRFEEKCHLTETRSWNKPSDVRVKSKPNKQKKTSSLKEQKDLREKALVMFLKPTKPRVKTPSVAWIFFDVINKDTARCILCENVIPTPLWNTNGLLRHLKKDHLDECEKWEAENVHNFKSSQLSEGHVHPVWQFFKKIDGIVREDMPTSEGESYACSHCDIVHVGLIVPEQIYVLEDHLTQFHSEDACKEYGMEKVAILCRKRKEEMKVAAEDSSASNDDITRASKGKSSSAGMKDDKNVQFGTGKIILQPHEIIQDIKKGLLNILAADFFSQFSRDTMQCKLCSASCRVLTQGPNRSNNLWKHLSVSHVDVHARLEAEREIIAQSLKAVSPIHPIWSYFTANDTKDKAGMVRETLYVTCNECQKEVSGVSVQVGGDLSSAVGDLEDHISNHHCNDGSGMFNQYQKSMSSEDLMVSLDHSVWIETRSGLDSLCQIFYDQILPDKTPTENINCRVCDAVLENSSNTNIDDLKRQHVLKLHKPFLLRWMKMLKQRGLLQDYTNIIDNMPEDQAIFERLLQIRDNDCRIKDIIINNSECICPKCDSIFVSSTALEYHDRYHHFGERPYACDECERTFVRSDELKTHKKYHMDRALQKGAMCVTCGKQFNSATARKRHENTVHLDIRNHICKECGKKFHSPQALERHSHTHSDEKPFSCTECGAKFREKHQLTSHLRTHTGEQSIACQNCPQTFKHYAARSKHKCTGELLAASNTISGSWDQQDIEKVDVSVVTVSSSIPHQLKQKVAG